MKTITLNPRVFREYYDYVLTTALQMSPTVFIVVGAEQVNLSYTDGFYSIETIMPNDDSVRAYMINFRKVVQATGGPI